jgi:hypothetical protein
MGGAYLELQQCICAVEAEGIEMLLSHLRDGAGVCDVGVRVLKIWCCECDIRDME